MKNAISSVLRSGRRTGDLGGTETTVSFTDAVLEAMEEQAPVGRGR
ncbi:hypothetical protein GCM10020331_069200 [Ectobacillus funiculus]